MNDGGARGKSHRKPEVSEEPQVHKPQPVAHHSGEQERERKGERGARVGGCVLEIQHREHPSGIEEGGGELGEGEPGEGLLKIPAVEHVVGDGEEERVVEEGGGVACSRVMVEAPAEVPLQVASKAGGEGDRVRPEVGRGDEGLSACVSRPLGEAKERAHREDASVEC